MNKSWKKIKIKDLGRVITGNTPPRKKPELYGKHTIFIKPTDINIGARYCFNPEECYSNLGYNKYKRSLIPKGATCVVTIGSIGKKIIKAHTDLFINQAMNAVIPSKSYDELFVFYLLKMNLPQLNLYDSGTASGRENVSKSSFSNIDITVPSSNKTRKKIGRILSSYDDLIENNLKRIKLLEEMAQITYEEWFVHMKFPDYKTTPIDTETGLPKGWSTNTISTICGINKNSIKNNTAPKEIRYIDISSANTGYYNKPQELKYISAPSRAKRKLKYGDTIFSTVRPNRKIYSLIMEDDLSLVASTGFAVLTPKIRETYSFVYLSIANQSFVEKAVSVAGGVAYPTVNQKDFEKIKITIPNNKLIKEFSELVNPNFKITANLKFQNQHLKEARDILLPRLMTGIIDIDKIKLPEYLDNIKDQAEIYNKEVNSHE